jgi:hypothetical protein
MRNLPIIKIDTEMKSTGKITHLYIVNNCKALKYLKLVLCIKNVISWVYLLNNIIN